MDPHRDEQIRRIIDFLHEVSLKAQCFITRPKAIYTVTANITALQLYLDPAGLIVKKDHTFQLHLLFLYLNDAQSSLEQNTKCIIMQSEF